MKSSGHGISMIHRAVEIHTRLSYLMRIRRADADRLIRRDDAARIALCDFILGICSEHYITTHSD